MEYELGTNTKLVNSPCLKESVFEKVNSVFLIKLGEVMNCLFVNGAFFCGALVTFNFCTNYVK